MNFWFEFFDIHMNEKATTCHECHGFKWKNINIYANFDFFLLSNTLFGLLDCLHTHNFTSSQHVGKDLKRLEYIEIFIIESRLDQNCDVCLSYNFMGKIFKSFL
jgi:hypothetical protein